MTVQEMRDALLAAFGRKPRCVCCRSKVGLRVEHIVPMWRGGSNEPDNLRVICHACQQQGQLARLARQAEALAAVRDSG